MKKLIKNILKSAGLKVSRIIEKDERPLALLQRYGINLILDVGANKGQYAIEWRNVGYKGNIISFEPVSEAFTLLKQKADKDAKWQAVKLGLGNFDGEAKINIAANSYSSSLLEMLPGHLEAAPESSYFSQENIIVSKLDSIFNQYCEQNKVVFLKLDTQGFERQILEGGKNSLKYIKGIQMEMSLVQLYKDEMLLNEAITYLDSLGFKLCYLENGFANKRTGQLLQVDGVFYKI